VCPMRDQGPLPAIPPMLPRKLASSRRKAASLLVEKRGLLEEVRRTRARRSRALSSRARTAGTGGSALRHATPR
jgi:hypothetical protein